MPKPSTASKDNCSHSNNDPKKALLIDLANLIDKFNALLAWLGNAAGKNTGLTSNDVVELNSSGKIPHQLFAIASTQEAVAGTNQHKIMTPLTTQRAITNITNGRLPTRKVITSTGLVTFDGNPSKIHYKVYGASGSSATTTSLGSAASALGGTVNSPGGAIGDYTVRGGAPGGGGLAIGEASFANNSVQVTIGTGTISGYVELEWYKNV